MQIMNINKKLNNLDMYKQCENNVSEIITDNDCDGEKKS
jgi:hypothetical protein